MKKIDPTIKRYFEAALRLNEVPVRQEDHDDVLNAFIQLSEQARLVTEFPLANTVESTPCFVP